MYFLLILFFISLSGIIIMISQKLILLKNKQAENQAEVIWRVPFLEEWKHLTIKNIKEHGYTGLVAIIRFYVKTINFCKSKLVEIKIKLKNWREKNKNGYPVEKKEANKFLKMISEYKHKIREIKHRIHEEENNS